MNKPDLTARAGQASTPALPVQDIHMEPLIVSALIEQGFASASKCVLAGKVVADMVLRRVALLDTEINRRKGDPSTRLHNLCEGIARDADGSEWSREEWERLDAENAKLRALAASHARLLSALKECLPFIDDALDVVGFVYADSAASDECRAAVDRARAAIAAAEGVMK